MTQRQTLSVLIMLGLFLVSPQVVAAWFSVSRNSRATMVTAVVAPRSSLLLRLPASTTNDNDVKDSEEVWRPDSTNPCWQNLLDDDCSMSTMYASSFIAGKWIKSMPCGEGIEDCDMPSALMTPETYPESGVVGVNVMDFLHLKRAASINKSL